MLQRTNLCENYRAVSFVWLFVVCRYLSFDKFRQIPTDSDKTLLRAFRAVSRETPYFDASPFSTMPRN
jgi:hypothetical protein